MFLGGDVCLTKIQCKTLNSIPKKSAENTSPSVIRLQAAIFFIFTGLAKEASVLRKKAPLIKNTAITLLCFTGTIVGGPMKGNEGSRRKRAEH